MQRYRLMAQNALCAIATIFFTDVFAAGVAMSADISLAGSEWGFANETGKPARYIQFAEDQASGNLGCNRFTGGYFFKVGELNFRPLASTRMACAPEAMKREQEFAALLSKVRFAEATHLKLVLKDADGEVLAELVRRDPD